MAYRPLGVGATVDGLLPGRHDARCVLSAVACAERPEEGAWDGDGDDDDRGGRRLPRVGDRPDRCEGARRTEKCRDHGDDESPVEAPPAALRLPAQVGELGELVGGGAFCVHPRRLSRLFQVDRVHVRWPTRCGSPAKNGAKRCASARVVASGPEHSRWRTHMRPECAGETSSGIDVAANASRLQRCARQSTAAITGTEAFCRDRHGDDPRISHRGCGEGRDDRLQVLRLHRGEKRG